MIVGKGGATPSVMFDEASAEPRPDVAATLIRVAISRWTTTGAHGCSLGAFREFTPCRIS
jgi:hypothetical protein